MQLVSMQYSEISHSYRQIPIAVLHEVEHDAMAWAIHRFQPVFLPVLVDEEDVLLVLEIVAALLPQLRVIDVGRNDFAVASDAVLRSHQFNQSVVDNRAVREEQS